MNADARAGIGSDSVWAPVDTAAEEQAWDAAVHEDLSITRAEGKAPSHVRETVRNAHATTPNSRSCTAT